MVTAKQLIEIIFRDAVELQKQGRMKSGTAEESLYLKMQSEAALTSLLASHGINHRVQVEIEYDSFDRDNVQISISDHSKAIFRSLGILE